MLKKDIGKVLFLLVIPAVTFTSCVQYGYKAPPGALFTRLTSKQTGIDFENKVTPTRDFNVFNYRNFYNGGGVAIGDVNNDGYADIFMVSNMEKNKLYLNEKQWHFKDVTDPAGLSFHKGWSTGVAMADVNGDGLLDIYVCNSGYIKGDDRKNQLFINQGMDKKGIPHFKDEAAKYGLDDQGLGTHAAFFDYDGDGDLDCYMLNNSFRSIASFGYHRNIRNIRDRLGGDKLYRNDEGKFNDVSDSANIYGSVIGFGLGVTVGDVNGDMWPDIYVSNDFFERDYLYINQRNGTYQEVSDDWLQHISQSSMGADMADINNDGYPEIFSTDMLPQSDYRLKTTSHFEDYDINNAKLRNYFHHQFMANMLQLNNGDSTFSEIGELAEVSATGWSWGALIFDMNNDGWKDLYVCNGIFRDVTNQDFLNFMGNAENKKRVEENKVFNFEEFENEIPSNPLPNYALINEHNLHFKNKASSLGLAKPSFSNGAAYGDLDNDGDLDLAVNNVNMPCFVYRNETEEKNHSSYLRVKLKGAGKNTLGVGARVTCFAKGQKFVLQQMSQRGFESSVDPVMVFGLGKISMLDSLQVIWPGPHWEIQMLYDIKVNQTLTLYQKKANGTFHFSPRHFHPYFENISATAFAGNSHHKEDPFTDFDRERLMPELLSTQGPKCATADVNGDGLTDIFIGGARGDTGKLFLQSADGKFKRIGEKAFIIDQNYEDVGAEFFDADGDGDMDLMVASGGNEDQPGSKMLVPRLYINSGKGDFHRTKNAIPLNVSTNASCIRACDFDEDGDMDVFVGGRDVPGIYGATPQSFLLINDGKGNFSDGTARFANQLQNVGMVTDASWTDIDGDEDPDLVVVGEWMPVTIFRNNGKRLIKWKELPYSKGWWNCIYKIDLNNDHKPDFVLGNLGLNSKFKADPAHPVQLYVNDFDHNGTIECILTLYKSDSISYPFILKGEMVKQMPVLKKRFLRFADYAGKSIQQVFTPEQMKGALILNAYNLKTSVMINEGNGQFKLQALPLHAQFSPIYGIIANDLDGDKVKDIFLVGNFYGVTPQVGRYDASYGVFLKGNGRGSYDYISPDSSGLFVPGEARDVALINGKNNQKFVLVARNDNTALLFAR